MKQGQHREHAGFVDGVGDAKNFAELMVRGVVDGVSELSFLLFFHGNDIFDHHKRIFLYCFQRTEPNTLIFLVQFFVVLYFFSLHVDEVQGDGLFQSRDEVLD